MQIKHIVMVGILFYYHMVEALGLNVSCNISATNFNFGAFNPYNYTPSTLVGSISVTCTSIAILQNVSYTLTFSTGNSGNASTRYMTSTSDNLNYNLYADSAYSQILGSGVGGTTSFTLNYTLVSIGIPRTDSFPIYARIPTQPLAAVGNYTDNITVTLNYNVLN